MERICYLGIVRRVNPDWMRPHFGEQQIAFFLFGINSIKQIGHKIGLSEVYTRLANTNLAVLSSPFLRCLREWQFLQRSVRFESLLLFGFPSS